MIKGAFASPQFNGDDVSRPHDILWNLENYIRGKGGRPTTAEQSSVAVIGGGMSGLLTAHFLRDLNPVLIEQAPAFGGNSKGERYGQTALSIGAAYIAKPDAGGEIEKLLGDLGLANRARLEAAEEQLVSYRAGGLKKFWSGETDPASAAAFAEVTRELARIYRDAYPEIPWAPGGSLTRAEFDALDQQTAAEWLHRTFPKLHPHVAEYFQLYCWSSLGGSLDELSAAQFLNFVAAETEGVVALPGGNAAIAEALYLKLQSKAENLRSYSMVLEVKNTDGGVEVLYEDSSGQLRLLRARAAVVAAPKYVARYIVKGLDSARDEFWKDLPYRAYVVVNVLLKQKVPARGFDIFSLENQVPATPTFGSRTDRAWADFVFAGWAEQNGGEASVLTLYKPLPFEGSRPLISGEVAHQRIREEIERELPKTLAGMGIPAGAIDGMRLTRWGHSLPLAQPGKLSADSVNMLAAPHGRIAFANQDCYMNPAFESCFAAARSAAAAVRKLS